MLSFISLVDCDLVWEPLLVISNETNVEVEIHFWLATKNCQKENQYICSSVRITKVNYLLYCHK